MGMYKKFMQEIKKYKDGVLAGVITGLALTCYITQKGTTSLMALNEPGIIDNVVGSLSPDTLLFVKLAIVYSTMGALIGYTISKYLYKR